MSLKSQGAKVDSWGVGTKLITGYDQPALGAVYKLVAVVDDNGRYVDRIKLSNNAEKVTTPGKKKVYRIINTKTGKAEGDYITLEHENPNNEKPLKMFHPVHTYKMKHIKHFERLTCIIQSLKMGNLFTNYRVKKRHKNTLKGII